MLINCIRYSNILTAALTFHPNILFEQLHQDTQSALEFALVHILSPLVPLSDNHINYIFVVYSMLSVIKIFKQHCVRGLYICIRTFTTYIRINIEGVVVENIGKETIGLFLYSRCKY